MLSQEIYDLWNAKTESDLHALLDNVNAPKIPKDVKSTTFRKAVQQRIEKRRTEDAQRSTVDRLPDTSEESSSCCSCFRNKESNKNRIWKPIECKSIASFENICVSSTRNFTKTISSVKALIQKLSYWESIKRGTDGLSIVGGYIWLLSYAVQHLIDCPNSNNSFSMQAHVAAIKDKYQELGQAAELFIDLTESVYQSTHHMRTEALQILKRVCKKWNICDENNPLQVRPEAIKPIARPRKRLGAGLDSPVDVDEDEDVFSVKWSPLIITIRTFSTEEAKPFGRLHPQDRVTIFQKFLKCTVDKVEMAAEDLTVISNQLSAVNLENEKSAHSREITLTMLAFTKGSNIPKSVVETEKKRLVLMINEFWYSLDVLHENIYILLRLVQETRDIIRTCYVYADIFYKWHLPNYDTFLTRSKGKHGSSASSQAKELLQKLGGSPSSKKLSETTSIMSLMDFSSSIYQGVNQEIPIECDGMYMRLRSNELDPSSEPMGLVSGIIDKRKSSHSVIDRRASVAPTKQ